MGISATSGCVDNGTRACAGVEFIRHCMRGGAVLLLCNSARDRPEGTIPLVYVWIRNSRTPDRDNWHASTSRQMLVLGFALALSFLLTFAGFGFSGSACRGLHAIGRGVCHHRFGAGALDLATGFPGGHRVGTAAAGRHFDQVSRCEWLAPVAHGHPECVVWCHSVGRVDGGRQEHCAAPRGVCFVAATILHAMAAGAALALLLGDALERFETGVTGQLPLVAGVAGVLVEPMMSALSTGNLRLSRSAQWLFFAANSANWGIAFALCVHTISIFWRAQTRSS